MHMYMNFQDVVFLLGGKDSIIETMLIIVSFLRSGWGSTVR